MDGLYPRKGSIMIGADADIAVWDPDKKVTLCQNLMEHGSDYTPYEGIEVTGWPVDAAERRACRRRRARGQCAGIRPVPGAPYVAEFVMRPSRLHRRTRWWAPE
jgi:hypothetical protein